MKAALHPKQKRDFFEETKVLIIVPTQAGGNQRTDVENFKREFKKNFSELKKASNKFLNLLGDLTY